MPASVSSEPFHALAASLRQGGFTAHGARLQGVLDGTWTTSSELIGELGVAVVAIRKECRPLSAAQKALVKQCLREVRKAWPGFGLWSWLPSMFGFLRLFRGLCGLLFGLTVMGLYTMNTPVLYAANIAVMALSAILFFWLRRVINRAHAGRYGTPHPALGKLWAL